MLIELLTIHVKCNVECWSVKNFPTVFRTYSSMASLALLKTRTVRFLLNVHSKCKTVNVKLIMAYPLLKIQRQQ